MFGRKKFKDLSIPTQPIQIPQKTEIPQQSYINPVSLPRLQKQINPQNEALKELRGHLLEVLNWIDGKVES